MDWFMSFLNTSLSERLRMVGYKGDLVDLECPCCSCYWESIGVSEAVQQMNTHAFVFLP